MHISNLLITGGTGFLGRKIAEIVDEKRYRVFFCNTMCGNLLSEKDTESLFEKIKPEYVIHCAGYNGGIQFNIDYPFDIFTINTKIGTNIIKQCIKHNVTKVASIITSCAYDCSKTELYPEDLLNGQPHSTVDCHGYAKRNLQLLSNYANTQYGLNAITISLPTLYGPGDSFHPTKTKVTAALIKKFVDAIDSKSKEVVIWGSGKPMRQFCYIDDAAVLVMKAFEAYDWSDKPYHIGCTKSISIRMLASLIADISGFNGDIIFDKSKPDGQMKKELVAPEHEKIHYNYTSMLVGLAKTIEYYRNTKR